MLFILVKSLDEVRWQCGVYGHHVFGRRSTQARSSVTAGRCTSCLSRRPCEGPFQREPRGFREWVVFTRCASSAWLGGIAVA